MIKKKDNDDSGRYFFNRLIIIMVFVAFAGTAFYLAFQQPVSYELEKYENNTLTNPIDEYIWKKYRDKEKSNSVNAGNIKKIDDDQCYTLRYLSQIESFSQIRISLIEGQKFFGPLSKIRDNAKNDLALLSIVEKIEKNLEDSNIYTLQILQNNFQKMRKEISRAVYINKTKKSFLLRSIARIITIEKIGDTALDEGGTSAVMERAARNLKTGAVKDAYIEIEENLNPEYLPLAQQWLSMAQHYITTNNNINDLGQYIHSREYMMKFYKECR
jgi:hypothetical protein